MEKIVSPPEKNIITLNKLSSLSLARVFIILAAALSVHVGSGVGRRGWLKLPETPDI